MLKMYTSENCHVCSIMKSYLKKQEVSYEEIDIDTDEDAQKRFLELGIFSLPILEYNGRILSGFVKPEVDAIIGELKELAS